MKSICIKTNDSNLLKYLLNELKYIDLNNICFSENEFKLYKNIIIHYSGTKESLFLSKISSILSFLVIDEFEESLLNRLLLQNYFYFDSNERKKIISICFDYMTDTDNTSANNHTCNIHAEMDNVNDYFSYFFDIKFQSLYNSFYKFLSCNKALVINGFINFRIKDYINILDDILSKAVNYFVIEKEYMEFISLLKLYINSQNYGCELVHIVFSDSESILLDENKSLILVTDDILNAKYLSDVSFSSNDYILNSLLNLLPKKIYIHLVDGYADEFINTLQLVFENRIQLCTDCDICTLYKKTNKNVKRD